MPAAATAAAAAGPTQTPPSALVTPPVLLAVVAHCNVAPTAGFSMRLVELLSSSSYLRRHSAASALAWGGRGREGGQCHVQHCKAHSYVPRTHSVSSCIGVFNSGAEVREQLARVAHSRQVCRSTFPCCQGTEHCVCMYAAAVPPSVRPFACECSAPADCHPARNWTKNWSCHASASHCVGPSSDRVPPRRGAALVTQPWCCWASPQLRSSSRNPGMVAWLLATLPCASAAAAPRARTARHSLDAVTSRRA